MSNKIKNAISIIKKAIDKKISINQSAIDKGYGRNYVANVKYDIPTDLESGRITENQILKFEEIYDEYNDLVDEGLIIKGSKGKKVKKKESKIKRDSKFSINTKKITADVSEDDDYDDRSKGWELRETDETIILTHGISGLEEGTVVPKITGYQYRVLVKNENPLEGIFTREEMDLLYRLYSSLDGANLTQRQVSRYFPTLTLRDLKRILRAFNISKQSIPIAPHNLEELPYDKIISLIWKNKEDSLLKKYESERYKLIEDTLKSTQKELVLLKSKFSDLETFTQNLDLSDVKPFKIKKTKINNEKALVVYLADMHIGAKVSKNSLFENEYNEKEYKKRLKKTLERILELFSIHGKFDKIKIINLGDHLDGLKGLTTRQIGGPSTHKLPQNLDDKEQFNLFIESMSSYFETLHEMKVANHYEYYTVSECNHSGVFGYFANRALQIYSESRYPDMKFQIFDNFVGRINYGVHTLLISHGKDEKYMKHGFPLVLDAKTENWWNDYITKKRINGAFISVVCGDLHQNLRMFGKNFRWLRVGSLFGGSDWVQHNYGSSIPSVSYEIIHKNENKIEEGIIEVVE